MFVPIGTPVYAPADGVVYGSGATIGPATGRWVGIDFDNGMRFRCMHLSRLVTLPKRVGRGALIGYSGASGYGHEDWSHLSGMPGAHTHVTLWPSHSSRFGYDPQGRPFTVDFMNYVGGTSGGGTTPQEDVMNADQEKKLDAVLQALGAGGLTPGLWPDTIMGNTRDIKAQVNGLPDALRAIMAQVNGVPDVLAEIRKDIKGVGVSGGQVDVPALSAALAKELGAALGNTVATAVLDGAAQRLIR